MVFKRATQDIYRAVKRARIGNYPTPPRRGANQFVNQIGLAAAALGALGAYGGKYMTSAGSSTKKRKFERGNPGYLAGRKRRLRNKPLKSKSKRRMNYFDSRGVRLNWEEGLDISDNKCVYVGHSLPIRKLFNVFTRSIYRSLMAAEGHNFQSWDRVPLLASNADPRVTVQYKDDAGQQVGFNFAMVYGTHEAMWSQFDAAMFNGFDITVSASGWRPGFSMESIRIQLGHTTLGTYIDAIELNCLGAMVQYNYNQSLKIQNVTPAADGGADADQDSDIFNVPLNGRLYETSGNYLKFKNPLNRTLCPNTSISIWPADCSAIIRAQSSVGAGTSGIVPPEPPQAYEFENCKVYSKVSMNPGAIKTSVISNRFSMNLDKYLTVLFGAIRDDGVGAGGYYQGHQVPMGKCRLFALEKVIGNILGTESSLRLRCEVDTKLQCYVKFKKNNFLAPKNEVI